ncbi:hypothetical protein BJV77DRAFT_1068855 [Russula vinacea]|nr:hypothetical protein BJV77DRAFT_1068855 [Russula vinacea]
MITDRATDTESETSVQDQNSEGQSNEEIGCTPATEPSQNQKIHDDSDKGSDSKREIEDLIAIYNANILRDIAAKVDDDPFLAIKQQQERVRTKSKGMGFLKKEQEKVLGNGLGERAQLLGSTDVDLTVSLLDAPFRICPTCPDFGLV